MRTFDQVIHWSHFFLAVLSLHGHQTLKQNLQNFKLPNLFRIMSNWKDVHVVQNLLLTPLIEICIPHETFSRN